MKKVLVNQEVESLIASIDDNIEIELAYDGSLKAIAKYKDTLSVVNAASMPELRRIIISAHPREFKSSLTEIRKQEIIDMIVFELFNISKALENEKKRIC